MEIIAGGNPDSDADGDRATRAFLSRFTQVAIDSEIAAMAIALRRERRLRLPDAIIQASARCNDALLVTRNSKDFPADDPGVRMPYSL